MKIRIITDKMIQKIKKNPKEKTHEKKIIFNSQHKKEQKKEEKKKNKIIE